MSTHTTVVVWLIGALLGPFIFGALIDHMEQVPGTKKTSTAGLVWLSVAWPISVCAFVAGVIVGFIEVKRRK